MRTFLFKLGNSFDVLIQNVLAKGDGKGFVKQRSAIYDSGGHRFAKDNRGDATFPDIAAACRRVFGGFKRS